MMEHVRIAVLDAYDHVVSYLDNSAPKALHYYDDELHEYLKGTAYTFSFCAGAKHEDSQYLVVGNKLSFVRGDKEYYLNIMSARQDEYKIEVEAYSLSFELLNEEKEAYKAEKAMSLKEYLSIFDFEKVLTLGNNEVSDKSIKHEWTGTDTLLARVFSLCNVFSAEAEFVIQLNDNYSLNRIVLNVYQEHSDTVQGVGVKRTDIILRYGKNVTGITKTAEITGLYTAIRPTGKDGLTVADLDKKEYDADGNLEYYTSKGSRNILAPQARDRFPSNLMSGENDRYIAKIWSYETDNINMLYGQALAELKKNCIPQVKYEVKGFFDTNIGDTVSIEDDQYIPTLYLEARVTEQVRSFTDRTRNKTTFDNFKEVQAQLDPSLVAKMSALIEQNKTYTCMISTDNGTTFKNNIGSTTLTASVRDGVNDVTDNFSIVWKKDGVDLTTGKSITVNAADVDGKSLYRFEALDTNGTVKGFYEVTVTDVEDGKDGANGADGKSSYTHIKYSDDGKTFTQPRNYASSNRNDWLTGYYGAGSTTSEEQPNKATDSYKSISMEKVIQIDPNETYQCSSGHDNVKLYFTLYDADGMYSKLYNPGAESFKFASGVSAVRMYLTCANSSIVSSLESWDELFSSGEVNPVFKMNYASEGDKPGAWMGTMTSDNPEPSTNFDDYTWVKIKGDPGKDGLDGLQGEKGDQGIPGKDGTSSYTHIAYANSADGHTDFSVSDSNREYIGMYVDEKLTDSENPDDYRWTLVKGQDGANGTPGKAGEDGKTPYLHIAYANSADGQMDFSVTDSEGKSYIGQYTDYEEPDSTDPSEYAWSKIKGEDGADGKDGTSSYTHIKYSDDGETFTIDIEENLASQNRSDWMTGYYGSGSMISDAAPNNGTSDYKRICMAPVAVNPGDKYFLSPGCSGINMGYTRFDVDGNYVSWSMGSQKDTEYTVPEDTYYISPILYDLLGKTVTSISDWDTLFGSGGIKPRFGIMSESLGDIPGAWMGTLVDDNPEPSLVFSEYTWKKIEGDPGKDGEPTGVTESAEEPTEKYVGMLWKNTGTTSGLVQGATYRWNGESWEMYKFSADNIEAQTFKGYTFDGSIFKSDFAEMDGSLTRYVGTMHIQNGRIKIECERQVRSSEESDWMVSSNNSIELNYDGFVIHDDGETAYLTLNDLKSLYSLLACHTFVTEKEYKVGTWIGGKPIYRRVFTLDALASSTNAVDLSGMDVEHLFFDLSHSNYETSSHIFPVVKTTTTSATDSITPSQAEIYFEKNTKVLKFKAGSNVGDGTLYLTVEYTKTTD